MVAYSNHKNLCNTLWYISSRDFLPTFFLTTLDPNQSICFLLSQLTLTAILRLTRADGQMIFMITTTGSATGVALLQLVLAPPQITLKEPKVGNTRKTLNIGLLSYSYIDWFIYSVLSQEKVQIVQTLSSLMEFYYRQHR